MDPHQGANRQLWRLSHAGTRREVHNSKRFRDALEEREAAPILAETAWLTPR